MKTKSVVIGAGAHARVIIDILNEDDTIEIVGIIDSVNNIGDEFYGYKIIGRQDNIQFLIDEYNFTAGIIGVGDNYAREKIADEILSQYTDFVFLNAISKSVSISKTAKIGYGNVLMPGVVVNSEAVISNHCVINTNSSLEHNGLMKDYSSLSAGVVTGGFCIFGKYTAIALGVTVLDRITIGENVVVGSGALVMKDLDDHGLYYGIPAKRIRDRKPFEKFLK